MQLAASTYDWYVGITSYAPTCILRLGDLGSLLPRILLNPLLMDNALA